MPRGLKILSVTSTLLMLFILLGGALVTKTDSGEGCGRSWPLCHGQLIPSEIDTALIIELSHRLVSGVSTFFIVALAIWSWKRIGHIREAKFLSFVSVLFLVIQALMGAGAVIWGQDPVIMALHFGISLISFASVLLLTLLIFEVDKKFDADSLVIDKKMRSHIWGISIYSYFVIFTGALVRQQKAQLACPDFPLCNNSVIGPPSTMYEWVQMGHRAAAIAFFVWMLIITIQVVKNYKSQPALYYAVLTTMTFTILQVVSGILSIYTMVALPIALMHALFITLIFGILCYLLMLASRSKKNQKEKGIEVA